MNFVVAGLICFPLVIGIAWVLFVLVRAGDMRGRR